MLSSKGSFPADPLYQSQLRSSAARYIVSQKEKDPVTAEWAARWESVPVRGTTSLSRPATHLALA